MGIYFTEIETTVVSWDILWDPSRLECAKTRSQLYSHYTHYGSAFGLTHFLCDDHSAVASCSTDGTVRTGFTSLLGAQKTPLEGLMEIFKLSTISDIDKECPDEGKVLEVSRKVSLADGKVDDTSISLDVGKYLQSIDSLIVHEPEFQSNLQILAYGGGAGVVRIHAVDLVQLLVAKEV